MKLKKSFISLLLMMSVSAFGALDLELTQGIDTAVPIAVIAFQDEQQLGMQELSEVIRSDLSHCGQFRLIGGRKDGSATTANFQQWRKQGADHLIIGSVSRSKTKPDQYAVSFELINLFDNHAHKDGSMLLRKKYFLPKANMRALGHHIADLVFHKLLGKQAAFSTHIAYVLVKKQPKTTPKYQLMVADIDGHNPQALVISDEPVMSPAWSPDGRRIAYVSFEGHKAAIFVQTLATGKRHKITDFDGINGAPAWSPDGKKLALVLSKTGYPKIYLLDLASKQLTQITKGWAIDTEPSFSPDGKSLIFTSNRGGGPQIYRVALTSGRPERLTFDGRYNATASYTRDGKALILLHKENGAYNIALQDLTSGRLEMLTNNANDQSPSLAPNDEMIVFASKYGTKQVLGMVSRDAKIRIRLPAPEGDVREPAWSPA